MIIYLYQSICANCFEQDTEITSPPILHTVLALLIEIKPENNCHAKTSEVCRLKNATTVLDIPLPRIELYSKICAVALAEY